MKTLINLTTSSEDMDRFTSQDDLLSLMEGFDGVELMCFEPDVRGIIPKERVLGLHMRYFPYWLDFWRGDEAALLAEFGSLDECETYYGGLNRGALIRYFRKDLALAEQYGVEYLVFHISDATIEESFTRRYRHTSLEVVEAVCELLNEIFADEDGSRLLLLENLWQPGLTFTEPDITERLFSGISYLNKGFMLDTGHLMHTELSLETQEEGLGYIHKMLDRHSNLYPRIRGVHLHQSLTGAYSRRMMKSPPVLEELYTKRVWQMFEHAFKVDLHQPFTCLDVKKLIERIKPDYLTYEFISAGNAQHRMMLAEQRRALSCIE